MKVESTLSSYFKYSGLVMAAVFALAIILGLTGMELSVWITQLGIILAIIIPAVGLIITMFILFANRELKYALIVVILLLVLALTILWRIGN